MNSFELVMPPTHLPITVSAEQKSLALAVVEEIERGVLWRAIVRQERKITINGFLPSCLELEPIVSITNFTQWTPNDAAEVVNASIYDFISHDPAGTTIFTAPGKNWPEPARSIGSFALTYMAGWEVTDTLNSVPASVQLMVERAVEFRAGGALAGFTIGSLQMDVADSYKTDRIPPEIASIGRAYQFRPGLFVGRP